jgi:saccharopine dehydrogenase-like NADP-dependent oxidoreductase
MSNRSLHQHFNHPRILIVGCGDVGQRMLPILVKTYKVFALTRQIENIKNIRSLGAMPILGDLDQPASLHRLSQIAPIVIHLAPPNTTGLEDLRTKALLAALGKTQGC